MVKINFSDNIQSRGRKLYLQTNTLESTNKIVSALFDGGRALHQEESEYDNQLSGKELADKVETIHNFHISSITLLYDISARVKTVRHAQSLNRLGLQFLKWNLLDEAVSEFTLAIQYDPRSGEGYLNLGEAFLRRGGLEEAVETLRKGVHIFPGYADMWQKLGKAYYLGKQLDTAVDAFEQALKINSRFDEPYFYKALCLMSALIHGNRDANLTERNSNRKQIKEILNRVAALSERFRTPEFEEAMRLFHKNNETEAYDCLQKIENNLQKVIDLGFDDLFYLRYMYGEAGRTDSFLQSYTDQLNERIGEHPDFPDLHDKMGVAYLLQCRNYFNHAIMHFQEACRLNPNFERAKNNLKLTRNEGKGLLLLLRAMLK